jgi:hypothetical protein
MPDLQCSGKNGAMREVSEHDGGNNNNNKQEMTRNVTPE